MKKFLALLMALVTVISLSACAGGEDGSKDTAQVTERETVAESGIETEPVSPDTTAPDPSKVSPDGYEFDAVRVDGLGEIFMGALNMGKLYESHLNHLPIVKLESLDLLNNFIEFRSETYRLNSDFDGNPSFAETMKKYDESFFEENTLLLVERKAASGTYRYGVSEVYIKDQYCTVYVEQINNPEAFTDDEANWFIVVPIAKSALKDVIEFDAVYRGA